MIFLAKFLRSKESKHFFLLISFVLLIFSVNAQKGVVNNGAKMIVNTGAVMKITGSGADYTNTTSGGTHGRIDLDGKIELEGDWTNNASFGSVMINPNTDGTVLFNGTSLQSILGSASTEFENITINNTSGLSLSADINVRNILTLTNGLVTLNASNLIIGTGGSLSGTFGSTKMFVTNSTGALRKLTASTGSFTFPIGEVSGIAEYSPVDFDLTGQGGFSSAWVGARVINSKHTNNTSPSEYLNRYWTLSSSGITAPVYDAVFNYLQADVVGTETNIYSAEYDGATRSVFSTVNATSNLLSVTGLSAFADYTGVDGTMPVVSISTTELDDPTNTNPIPFTITFSEEVAGFTYTDIIIDNGSTSSINTSDNIEFTFDLIPVKDSIVTIDINAGVATDIAANDNIAATTYRIEYDGTNPVVNTLYPEDNQANVALTDNLQMTFNENVYLNSGNIEIRHVSDNSLFESIVVATLSGDGTGTIIIDPSSDFESQIEYYVLVSSGAFTDAAGNEYAGISGTTDWTFITVDINNPYITSNSPVDGTPDVSVTSDLVITFSENVNAVAGKYITIMNASMPSTHQIIEASNTGIITINNAVVTITSDDFDGETDYYVLIDEGAFEDTESNPFAGISSSVYWNFTTEDILLPTVTLTSTESDPTNVSPFEVTIDFSEVVSGFDSGDITVGNGVAGNLNTTDDITFTADITPTVDGLVTVDIAGGVAIDASGNGNTAASQFSITYDITSPTVILSTLESSPMNSSPFEITIEFSEVVSGFDFSDITVGNGTADNVNTSDNITFTADITPSADGLVTVDIVANVAQDAATNGNTASTQLSITYDGTSPGVTITSAEPDPTNVSPFEVTITFSEVVIGFEIGDIIVGNGAATNLNTSDNTTFTADITPTADGQVTVDINAGVAEDNATNTNTVATQFSIEYDSQIPGVTITSSETNPTNNSLFNIDIVFTEVITGFDLTDINVTNGAVSNLNTTDNISFTADITITAEGTVTVQVPADVVVNAIGTNNTASNVFNIEFDSTSPTISVLSPADNVTTVTVNSNLQITFSENVVVSSGNITIMNSTTSATHEVIDVTTGLVSISTNTVTINPSTDFDESSNYYVLVDNDAFRDGAGNGFTGITTETVWNYRTMDNTAPMISLLSPVDGATDVPVSSNLQITFTENVVANSGSLINIMDPSGIHRSIDVFSGEVEIAANIVTIDPATDFESQTDYYILIDATAFDDESGNSFTGISDATVWNFTSEDVSQPTVAITSSATGTVTGSFDILVTFNEVVTGFTSSDISLSNGSITGFTETTTDLVWTVTIDPTVDGTVSAEILAGVAQDAAGNVNIASNLFAITYDSGVGFKDQIPYEIAIYSVENRVIVEFTNEGNYQFGKGVIEVYNLLGQKIVETTITDFVKFEIKVDHVSQIYVVKVVIDGVDYTKRLYIE